MFPCCRPNITNKTCPSGPGLDELIEGPGQLLTHDGFDLAALAPGADGQVLAADSSAPLGLSWRNSGEPNFPGSSTDNAVVRFDGTSGGVVQGSKVLIDDDGSVYLPAGEAVQWGSNVKLYHNGGMDLRLGNTYNGDFVDTSFSVGKVWTNSVYTTRLESNVAMTIDTDNKGLRLASGSLTVDDSVAVKQDVEVDGYVEVGGELRADTVKPASQPKVTVDSPAEVLGDLGVAGGVYLPAGEVVQWGSDVKLYHNGGEDLRLGNTVTGDYSTSSFSAGKLWTNEIYTPSIVSNIAMTIDTDNKGLRLASGDLTVDNSVAVKQDVEVDGYVEVGGELRADTIKPTAESKVTVDSPAEVLGNLEVAGSIYLPTNNAIQWGTDAKLYYHGSENALILGNTTTGDWVSRLFIVGNVETNKIHTPRIESNIAMTIDTDNKGLWLASGNLTVEDSVTVKQDVEVDGYVEVDDQVYAGGLNIVPSGSLAWKDMGSGNGGALVNTADGQWEFRSSGGSALHSTVSLNKVILTSKTSSFPGPFPPLSSYETVLGARVTGDTSDRVAVKGSGVIYFGRGSTAPTIGITCNDAGNRMQVVGIAGLTSDFGCRDLAATTISANSVKAGSAEIYSDDLYLPPGKNINWVDRATSSSAGALVNTGDGQWELQDSSGETDTTSLKVGHINGLPATNWLVDTQFEEDLGGVMGGGSCWVRVAKMTDKIWYFEVGETTFIANKNGTVMFDLGIPPTSFIRPNNKTPMWVTDRLGFVTYDALNGYLVFGSDLSDLAAGFLQGNAYSWHGVSFTLSEV